MGDLRIEHAGAAYATAALDLTRTTTDEVAADREAIARDTVEPARPPKFVALPSDGPLAARDRASDPISVGRLGALPGDEAGLQARVAKLVRAQGLSAVRRYLRDAREGARAAQATLLRHGRSDAHPAEILHRLEVMEAYLPRLAAERGRVQQMLQPRLLDEAYNVMDAASSRIDRLEAQYFTSDGRPRTEALRSLREDAKALARARATFERAPGDPQAVARYQALHREVSGRHALLATFDLDSPEVAKLKDLARDLDSAGDHYTNRPLDAPVRGMLADVRASIADMQEELRNDPAVVWRLPSLVDATMIREGVPAHGMVAAHARDVVRERAQDEALLRGFVSILSVGLGVAAALPTGGTSLAVAAAATAAVDGYQLYLSLEDYRLFSAASGVAIDRRRALSDEVPSAGWLAIDAVGAAVGVVGSVSAVRKTAFARLLAKDGPVGDMARGLERKLGADRAAVVVDRLTPEDAELLFRDLEPATWMALSKASPEKIDGALAALGADGLRTLEEALGSRGVGEWVAALPPKAWAGLASTGLEPEPLSRIAARFSPRQVSHLAPDLKGRGLAELAESVGDAKLEMAADHVIVDGQLRLEPFELLRFARQGTLGEHRSAVARLRAKSPSFAELGPLGRLQIRQMDDLAAGVKAGGKPPKLPKGLKVIDDASPGLVLRVARELAGDALKLSARAEALAQAAPELRGALEVLETSTIRGPARARTLGLLEEAVAFEAVTIDRAHLGDLIRTGVPKALGAEAAEAALDSHLLELEYALHVVESGGAKKGSTVFLGVKAGQKVQLSPGGPVVELVKPAHGQAGVLQDIDVLYLTPNDEVQLVEVKRSGQALWEALEKTKGHYLDKFAVWRDGGQAIDQGRRLAVALRLPADGYLDRTLSDLWTTPRNLLDEAMIEVRTSWRSP